MEKFFEAIRQQKAVSLPVLSGELYMIVGLGNPGREYRESRHNFGFMVADEIAATLKTDFKKEELKALTATGVYSGKKVLLAKPQTYMNCSGQAVAPLLHYYKIPIDHLLVIHDDMDLPFGQLRMRPHGGFGGQKGLGSIIQELGTENFARLRCGTDHPSGQMDVKDYVLNKFSKEQCEQLPAIKKQACEAALAFLSIGLDKAMTKYNGMVKG